MRADMSEGEPFAGVRTDCTAYALVIRPNPRPALARATPFVCPRTLWHSGIRPAVGKLAVAPTRSMGDRLPGRR